jgi:hypothetical protein
MTSERVLFMTLLVLAAAIMTAIMLIGFWSGALH